MSTNAPAYAYAERSVGSALEERQGVFGWLLGRLQTTLCAMHGHDAILQYERNRIFLRCTSCGHETPGWEVAQNSARHASTEPRQVLAGDLAVARKVA
jgi:hypothetical protein